MHRLHDSVTAYCADLATTSLRTWQRFFFTPSDPTSLGLIRFIVGALTVWNLATLGPDLFDYLGTDGWIGPAAVRQYIATNAPGAWSFWLLIPDSALVPAWLICLGVAACFTLGLGSRTTAILTWAIAVSTARRAPVTLFGFDQTNATWLLYLAVTGASGQACSLDRWLAHRRSRRSAESHGPGRPPRTVAANVSLRLIQLHLTIIYGSAGLSKLMAPEWWDGSALAMILLTPEFRRLDPTWFLKHPAALQCVTHAGLALEIAYPALIWNRRLRPLLLLAVVGMHFSIDLILGLTEFGLSMVAANLAFVVIPTALALPTASQPPLVATLSSRNRLKSALPKRSIREDPLAKSWG